jgi:hypothetical protein
MLFRPVSGALKFCAGQGHTTVGPVFGDDSRWLLAAPPKTASLIEDGGQTRWVSHLSCVRILVLYPLEGYPGIPQITIVTAFGLKAAQQFVLPWWPGGFCPDRQWATHGIFRTELQIRQAEWTMERLWVPNNTHIEGKEVADAWDTDGAGATVDAGFMSWLVSQEASIWIKVCYGSQKVTNVQPSS